MPNNENENDEEKWRNCVENENDEENERISQIIGKRRSKGFQFQLSF